MMLCVNEKKSVPNPNYSDSEPKTFFGKMDKMYQQEMPGVLGFFTLATPLAALADTWRNVPPENGATTRVLITAAGIAGMQHLISEARKKIYHRLDIYYMSEKAKCASDFLFGAAVGAALNPIFHGATYHILDFTHSVPLQDSFITGGVVGGLTGLCGWLASDAYSHSWQIPNTPSRTIKIPGTNYLKALPSRVKKTLAIGATILSLWGTGEYYSHRYDSEQSKNYASPSLESKILQKTSKS